MVGAYSWLRVAAAFIYAQVKSGPSLFFYLFKDMKAWSSSEVWNQSCFCATNPLFELLFRPKSQQFLSQCKLESSQLETVMAPVGPRDALKHSSVLLSPASSGLDPVNPTPTHGVGAPRPSLAVT